MVNRSHPSVLEILTRDHDELRSMLEKLGTSSGEAALTLLRRLRDEVRIHGEVEDELVYPAICAMLDDEATERMAEDGREEHAFINGLLDEALRVPTDSVSFGEDLLLAREAIERHTGEEEDVLFPQMERACSQAFLIDLGHRVTQRKAALRRQARRRRSDAPKESVAKEPRDARVERERSKLHDAHGPEPTRAGGSKTELMRRLQSK